MAGMTTHAILESLKYFDGSCLADDFKNDYALPTPHPVLTSGPYFLIDGGNGRCYLWHDKSDCVMELYERNLVNVLSTLRSDAGRWGLVRRGISSLEIQGCGKDLPPGPET